MIDNIALKNIGHGLNGTLFVGCLVTIYARTIRTIKNTRILYTYLDRKRPLRERRYEFLRWDDGSQISEVVGWGSCHPRC